MKKNLLWQIGAASAVIGGIVSTYAFGAYQRRSSSKLHSEVLPKYRRLADKNLLTPADWTFYTIWPTIYAGTIGLSIHQALPAEEANPRYEKARPWLMLCYSLNALFGYLFSRQDQKSIIGSNIVTVLSLPPAVMLHRALEIGKTPVQPPERYVRIPVSLYAGWLSVASVVAGAGTLIASGTWKRPKQDEELAAVVVAATAGLGYVAARRLNDPVYLVPFAWGFAGIAVKQYGKNNLLAGVAGTLALAKLAVLVRHLPKGTFKRRRIVEEDDYDLGAEFEMIDPTPRQIRRERMKEAGIMTTP
ncbi:hypothetical protein GCM10023189_57740 [Nibrella saemangeumensis]|uniref:Tryptophan-rich sensory protein n=1 Tax=Nibrella saemangeumensis TaxID=1084526 RepID=A0ABP8NRM0_9BACT